MGGYSGDVVVSDVSAATSSQHCRSGDGVIGGEIGMRLCAAICSAAPSTFTALLSFDGTSVFLFPGEGLKKVIFTFKAKVNVHASLYLDLAFEFAGGCSLQLQ